MQRYFFSGATETSSTSRAGSGIPAALLEHAKLGRDVVVAGVHDHLEIWDRAAWRARARRGRRECGGCCRTSCSQARLITSPFSPTEVRERLAVAAGRDGRRLHLRRGRARGAARGRPAAASGKLIAIDRDPTARRTSSASSSAARVQARLLRGDFGARAAAARRERRARRRDPARPRRLVDAARPARARLLLRRRRAARHAHGHLRRSSTAATSSTSGRSASSPPSSAATARSGTRGRSRARSCAGAGEQPFERTGELVDTIKAAIPAPARFGEGHPAKRVFQALRIAVNDELALARGGAAGGARDAAARRPARGDLVPLARGPDRQAVPARRASAAARARPTSRSASAATSPSCARSRGGRCVRARPRSRANPRSASARLRAAVKVG